VVDSGVRWSRRRLTRQLVGRPIAAHVLTHAHFDHAGCSAWLCHTFDLPLWCGAGDAPAIASGHIDSHGSPLVSRLQRTLAPVTAHPVSRALVEGDVVAGFEALEVPGHSPGAGPGAGRRRRAGQLRPAPKRLRRLRYETNGGPRMKLPKSAHTARPWRVHEITRDFKLEDVWELPTPGGPDDLARLVQQFTSPGEEPLLLRALFALRWKLGDLFGWDKPGSGVGERVRSLRERLPADLLEAPRGPDVRAVPGREAADGPPIFCSVYQTHDEWAAELSNRTVHAVLHMGWVPDDPGTGYRAQMAVLVKPNGRFGKAYMAAIKPLRYALVYPLLLRSIGRQWQMQAAG
jgi:hypothetical protein